MNGTPGKAAIASRIWEPSAGHIQVPIWPGTVPNALPHPKPESVGPPPGREWWPRANNVSRPTMTIYAPTGANTGAAVMVLPGGGYQFLAMDLEGTEICDWLTSRGITCVLLKYRVPESGPTYRDGKRYYPPVPTALQDAQRTLGLIRKSAKEHGIDPNKIGVMGFSAGGHLAAALSTNFAKRAYRSIDAADVVSCRPDFAMIAYPGHIWAHEDEEAKSRDPSDLKLRGDIIVSLETPPTFIIHAENDDTDSVQQSLAYYIALKEADVPAEMHIYAEGGHAFGVRPTKSSIGNWPKLAEQWLRSINVIQ
ncbi:xylanase [Sphingomonas sp. Leaf242]|nr:xylanase [Sphingomonas sp. Leaf242]